MMAPGVTTTTTVVQRRRPHGNAVRYSTPSSRAGALNAMRRRAKKRRRRARREREHEMRRRALGDIFWQEPPRGSVAAMGRHERGVWLFWKGIHYASYLATLLYLAVAVLCLSEFGRAQWMSLGEWLVVASMLPGYCMLVWVVAVVGARSGRLNPSGAADKYRSVVTTPFVRQIAVYWTTSALSWVILFSLYESSHADFESRWESTYPSELDPRAVSQFQCYMTLHLSATVFIVYLLILSIHKHSREIWVHRNVVRAREKDGGVVAGEKAKYSDAPASTGLDTSDATSDTDSSIDFEADADFGVAGDPASGAVEVLSGDPRQRDLYSAFGSF